MYLPMLAVDKNVELSLKIQAEWKKRGVDTIRVDSMQEAIEKLAKGSFLYTGINADNINYLPLLKAMTDISPTPVFLMTSNFRLCDQTEAFRHGADGYAPFEENINDNIDSCMALLNRISERGKRPQDAPGIIAHGDILLLTSFRQAFRNDKEIELTRYEYDLLCYLMYNRGKLLTRQQIFENVWDAGFMEPSANALWCQIRELRKKLDPNSQGTSYITTLRKVGYKFNM